MWVGGSVRVLCAVRRSQPDAASAGFQLGTRSRAPGSTKHRECGTEPQASRSCAPPGGPPWGECVAARLEDDCCKAEQDGQSQDGLYCPHESRVAAPPRSGAGRLALWRRRRWRRTTYGLPPGRGALVRATGRRRGGLIWVWLRLRVEHCHEAAAGVGCHWLRGRVALGGWVAAWLAAAVQR